MQNFRHITKCTTVQNFLDKETKIQHTHFGSLLLKSYIKKVKLIFLNSRVQTAIVCKNIKHVTCSTNLFNFGQFLVKNPIRTTAKKTKDLYNGAHSTRKRLYTCNVQRIIFAVYISMWCKMSSKRRSNAFAVLMLLLSSTSKHRVAVSIRRLQT